MERLRKAGRELVYRCAKGCCHGDDAERSGANAATGKVAVRSNEYVCGRDLLLGDGDPFGGGHILADTTGQFGQVCKSFHSLTVWTLTGAHCRWRDTVRR